MNQSLTINEETCQNNEGCICNSDEKVQDIICGMVQCSDNVKCSGNVGVI